MFLGDEVMRQLSDEVESNFKPFKQSSNSSSYLLISSYNKL